MPVCVKEWDWIVGCNEAFTFIKGGSPKYFGVDPVRRVHITYWTATYAEEMFLSRFKILTEER
jgi:hypothetical protein